MVGLSRWQIEERISGARSGRPAGFHPEGRYEFRIHLDGAATEQPTYRLSFAPADASGTQHAAIDRLAGTEAGDDCTAGARIAEGPTGEAISGDLRPVLDYPRRPGPHAGNPVS